MVENALGKAAALALYRVEYEHGRLVLDALGEVDGFHDLLHVVAIGDINDMPAEGFKLFADLSEARNLVEGAAELKVVLVNEADDVREALGGGKYRALPDLALLALAVAQEDVDIVLETLFLAAHGNAETGREALAKRTGGHVHAGGLVAVGVAGQSGAGPIEGLEFLPVEEAAQGEGRVHRRARVALGHYKAVTQLPLGILGVYVHDIAVEAGHEIAD